MREIKIKPLSVNEAWQGRRYKTKAYKAYEKAVLMLLPKSIDVDPSKPLAINLEFGFSNSGADIDNPIKPILDILQKKYGINDNKIYSLNIKKFIVKNGEEFARFEIYNYENNRS